VLQSLKYVYIVQVQFYLYRTFTTATRLTKVQKEDIANSKKIKLKNNSNHKTAVAELYQT